MRILHLTDLHLTEPNTSFEGQWAGVQGRLPREFDFVVVSGDLTQKADPNEYRALERFLVDRILPRVKRAERARVVLIPGNHDVSWGADFVDAAGVPDAPSDYYRDPDASAARGTRMEVGAGGARTFKVDRAKYNRRFDECQRFFDDFYGAGLAAPHRAFALNATNPDEHWSAHVFPAEGVAFVGLSSCAWNDKYWRGGGFSEAAVSRAADHLERVAPLCLRVAVWHHGLVSPRGVPDHVALRELGHIINQRFQLGIHGHTHQDEVDQLLPLFGDRAIPIVATGSFGVGPTERPGGVPNQVSVMELTHAFVRWRIFNGDDRGRQWNERPPLTLTIRNRGDVVVPRTGNSFAARQERSATVDEQGLVRIDVAMHGLDLDGDLQLAAPAQRWGTLVADQIAIATAPGVRAAVNVDRDDRADCSRFSIQTKAPISHQQLTWSYTLTNVFALDAAEIPMLSGPRSIQLADDEHDVWMHTVNVCTGDLLMRLELPPGYLLKAGRPRAQYESRDGGWVDDPDQANLSISSPSNDSIALSVAHPRPGYRYGIVYSLAKERPQLAPADKVFLDTVIEACRDVPLDEHALSRAISDAVGGAIDRVLGPDVPTLWVGHLWHPTRQVLSPAFGNFPPRSWGTQFRYGEGVAGHSFRVRGPAVYYVATREAASRALYLSASGGRTMTDHRWVISLPLLLRPGGPSIGTIGFAHYDGESQSELLEQYAREVTACARPDDSGQFGAINKHFAAISHGASFALWKTLSAEAASDRRLMHAQDVLGEWPLDE